MRARLMLLMAAACCLTVVASCRDKQLPTRPASPSQTVYPDLKEKDDVFEYIERVYEELKPERYPKLLDEDVFNFRFGDEDYNSGYTPRSWGRTEELAAVQNILGGHAIETYGAVTHADLTLTPEGDWVPIPQTEPPYAGEVWYQKTFSYRFTFTTTTGWDLRTDQDRKALFIVRFTEADGDSCWRIVQWNDDIF